jgi:predicted nuclease with TOPRIM domain
MLEVTEKIQTLKEHKSMLESVCEQPIDDMDLVNDKIKSIENEINRLESSIKELV